jgi:hypothetical protein
MGWRPRWTDTKYILRDGTSFPLLPISTNNRIDDTTFSLPRRNHKSILKNTYKARKLIHGDVIHGFQLPLRLDFFKGASLAPAGMAFQGSIYESGKIIEKERLTHDQSMPGTIGLSMNLRLVYEALPLCMFGVAIQSMIHNTVYCRWIHPSKRMMMGKYNLKSAYRRAHNSAAVALDSMAQFDGILFIALHQTFGGKPNPALWSGVS